MISAHGYLRHIGAMQLWPSWPSFTGGTSELNLPEGEKVYLKALLSGPKKGNTVIEAVELDGYDSMELLDMWLYRGQVDKIPQTGELSDDIQEKLIPATGARVSANVEGEADYLVYSFVVTGKHIKGPLAQKITYRSFGLRFDVGFDSR